jgi:hypothetical protein
MRPVTPSARLYFAPPAVALVLALCAAFPAAAQARVDLFGRVLDGTTDGPVAGAEVRIPALRVGAVADREGRFTLGRIPAGTYQVHVGRLGYSEVVERMVVNGDAPVEVHLLPQPLVLEGLTVALTSLDRRTRRAGIAYRLVTRDRLVASSHLTVRDYLTSLGIRELPETEMQADRQPFDLPSGSTSGGLEAGWQRSAGVFVRGMERPLRVMIDEQPASGGLHSLAVLRTHEVHQIEWYPGASAIYVFTRAYVERLAAASRRAEGIPPFPNVGS